MKTQGNQISLRLLQGEIEQLTISRESSAVSKQCASSRFPITTRKNDDNELKADMFEMQGDDPSSYIDKSRINNGKGKNKEKIIIGI